MIGATQPSSAAPDSEATRKVLRLLEALRRSQAGGVIYRQVERMLNELVAEHFDVQQAYAAVVNTLLDVYANHLRQGSPLQVQVRLLQARLQPPLTISDLNALRDYIEVYAEQIAQLGAVDAHAFGAAMRPLLEAFGIEEPLAPVAKKPEPEAETPEEPQPTTVAEAQAALTGAGPKAVTETGAEHPAGAGQPEAGEAENEPATPESTPVPPRVEGDQQTTAVYRSHLDARNRDMQALQAGLANHVQDTIAQNQEFGVLLEVVLGELQQASDASEIENLRWTLIREVEKLISGHQELAEKLDGAYQYLKVLETDSQQLSDELCRVRLLSLTDELTGLPNRRAFLRRLEDEVARVQRYGFPLSMALIDLDYFKEVNDKFGHAGGDEVLRVYARNVLSIFRHHDLVARYGGEEFAVLLPNTDAEGALRALMKVRKRAAETRWQSNGDVHPVPTFSAGVALYKPGETHNAFIERVDKALYRAKRLGRDRVEMDRTYEEEGVTVTE